MTTVADWNTFYLMAGDATAALTGLLFVAASLHLREVTAQPKLTRRLATALAGMGLGIIFCGFMLVPGLTVQAAGIGVSAAGFLYALVAVRPVRGQRIWLIAAFISLSDVLLGVLMILGWADAMYLVAAGISAAIGGLLLLSWRLLTMAIAD